MFVAAHAGMEMDLKKGQRNPLIEAVKAISITGEAEDTRTPEERELDEMRGEVVAQDYRDDPRLQAKSMTLADPRKGVEAANAAGSFEALMAGWGGQAFDTATLAGDQGVKGGR